MRVSQRRGWHVGIGCGKFGQRIIYAEVKKNLWVELNRVIMLNMEGVKTIRIGIFGLQLPRLCDSTGTVEYPQTVLLNVCTSLTEKKRNPAGGVALNVVLRLIGLFRLY
jgi:hypothetical protein